MNEKTNQKQEFIKNTVIQPQTDYGVQYPKAKAEVGWLQWGMTLIIFITGIIGIIQFIIKRKDREQRNKVLFTTLIIITCLIIGFIVLKLIQK